MKTNKRKQPKMKQMNASFKQGLLYWFKGLISNNACYEGAKSTPWWISLILVFISTAVALVPTMVFYGNRTGYEQISTPNNGLESTLTNFLVTLVDQTDPVELFFNKAETPNEDPRYYLDEIGDGWKNAFGEVLEEGADPTDPNAPVKAGLYNPWISTSSLESITGVPSTDTYINFEVYRIKRDVSFEDEYAKATAEIENLLAGKRQDGALRTTPDYYEPLLDDDGNQLFEEDGITPKLVVQLRNSFIYFSKTFFRTYIATYEGAITSNYVGAYDKMPLGRENGLLSLGNINIDGVDYTISDFVTPLAAGPASVLTAYQNEVLANFEEFYNLGFNTAKWASFWMASSITYSIYVGIIFVLSLVVFLTTRGFRKKPRTNVFSYLDALKMVCWLSFTCGVLSLVGFFMPQYSAVFFVILITVRCMWFSFKTLKPTTEAGSDGHPANKPLPRGRG